MFTGDGKCRDLPFPASLQTSTPQLFSLADRQEAPDVGGGFSPMCSSLTGVSAEVKWDVGWSNCLLTHLHLSAARLESMLETFQEKPVHSVFAKLKMREREGSDVLQPKFISVHISYAVLLVLHLHTAEQETINLSCSAYRE